MYAPATVPGTIVWLGGNIEIDEDSELTNETDDSLDATIDLQTDADITGVSSSIGTFTNQGTFQKSDGSGISDIYVDFSNSGTVEIESGTLRLQGTSESSGDFEIGNGLVLEIAAGTHTFDDATTSGLGTTVLSGGTLEAVDLPSIANFTFTGGELTGSGTLAVTEEMTWTAGEMHGDGELKIASTAELLISGSGTRYIYDGWKLRNEGDVTWSDDGLIHGHTAAGRSKTLATST